VLAVTNQWDQRLFANYHLVFITFVTSVYIFDIIVIGFE